MGLNRQLLGVAASYSPLPLASAYASAWAALAAVAALYQKACSGTVLGDAIEVPLASCLLETLCHNSLHLDGIPEHYLSARQRRLAADAQAAPGGKGWGRDFCDFYDVQDLLDPFYASYTCRDARPFYLVCPSHRAHQERALEALGLQAKVAELGLPVAQTYSDAVDDLAEAPRHGLGAAQAGDAHAAALRKLLRAAFLTRTAMEWEAIMGAVGVPGAAHRSTAEWLRSKHAHEAGLVLPMNAEGPEGAERAVRPGPIAWVLEVPIAEAAAPRPRGAAPGTAGSVPASQAAAARSEGRHAWLRGVRVLDMANVIAGPTIGAVLARLGADVIKIDPPSPTYAPETTVLYGLAANVGKRSILLDVADEPALDEGGGGAGGRGAFHALLRRADVLVANATDASLARLRCSPADLATVNSEIVLCRFDAWGGPAEGRGDRAAHLGYDDNVQAALGIMERFGGGLGRVEEHAHIGTIDVIAGVGGALAAVAALYHREVRSGSSGGLLVARASLAALGQLVQFPFCCGVPSILAAEAEASPAATLGSACRGEHALLRCYEAADGEWLLLHASLHPYHRAVSAAQRNEARAGLTRLASAHPALRIAVMTGTTGATQPPQSSRSFPPALASNGSDKMLAAALATAFRGGGGANALPSLFSAAAWVARLRASGVAAVVLHSLAALREAHLCERLALHGPSFQFLRAVDHPVGSALTAFAPLALRPHGTPLAVPQSHAPAYGAHTRQVLTEAGVDATALLAGGAASEGWSRAYLPGRPPPPPAPQAVGGTASAAAVATALEASVGAEAERCPVCLEDMVRRVQLGCGHSLCGGCAQRCGEAGHRRCPVCRAPHLLHPARLAQRSSAWRTRYASWRVGGHAGARGELSSIRMPAPDADRAGGASMHGSVGHSPACGDVHRASLSVPSYPSAPDLVKLGD